MLALLILLWDATCCVSNWHWRMAAWGACNWANAGAERAGFLNAATLTAKCTLYMTKEDRTESISMEKKGKGKGGEEPPQA